MKYKIGDYVKIKEDLENGIIYGGLTFMTQMGKGTIQKIIGTTICCDYIMESGFNMSEEMIDYEVITGIDFNISDGTLNICANEINFINNESEDKNMKLLKIYREREFKGINESYELQKEEILSHDKIVENIKKINEILEEDGQKERINESSFCTLETKKELMKLEEAKQEEYDYIYKFLDEVEARLEMTNDYDKQIEILKTYKILDEEGKINNEL